MFRLGMVEQRPFLAFQERGAVADPPAGDFLAAIDKPRIAADETAHLQQPRRPQLRKFGHCTRTALADVSPCVKSSQEMLSAIALATRSCNGKSKYSMFQQFAPSSA